MTSCTLHILPPNSGGVARFVRSIRKYRTYDRVLHVSERQWVIENGVPSLYLPVAADLGAEQLQLLSYGVSLIHAHSCLPESRAAVARLVQAARVNYGITLHDIAFADRSVAIEESEARRSFLSSASFITAPSNYIVELAKEFCSAASVQLIEHGSAPLTEVEWKPLKPPPSVPFPMVVVGAIGQHKGLERLLQLAPKLPTELRIAVVGYIDGQIEPGWLLPDRIWMTGPFEPEQLPSIVEHLQAQVAWFPNLQPESFSYALSDAWQAGLYALVPDSGALAERVRRAGSRAGACYPTDAETSMILASLREAFTCAEPARVRSSALIPDERVMMDELARVYSRACESFRSSLQGSGRTTLLALAAHLDDRFFREELRRSLGQIDYLQRQVISREQELVAVNEQSEQRHAEILRLEQSLQDTLEQAKSQAERASQDIKSLQATIQHQESELAKALAVVRKLELDVADTLAIAHHRERALAKLPRILRNWLLRTTQHNSKP